MGTSRMLRVKEQTTLRCGPWLMVISGMTLLGVSLCLWSFQDETNRARRRLVLLLECRSCKATNPSERWLELAGLCPGCGRETFPKPDYGQKASSSQSEAYLREHGVPPPNPARRQGDLT